MRTAIRSIALLAGVAVVASTVTFLAVRARAAGIPNADVLTYSGYLENPDGSPVTGNKSIGLSVYDAETDGNEVCALKPSDIEPVAGRFQLALPEKCTASVKANPHLWVEVMVEGALLGRTKLGAVPYAVEAGHATEAGALEHANSGFRATLTSNRSIATSTPTKLIFDTEAFDLGNEYDVVKGEFSPNVDGFYFVECALTYEEPAANTVAYYRASIYVDGAPVTQFGFKGEGTTPGRTAQGIHQLKAKSIVTCVASHDGSQAQTVRKEVEVTHFAAARLSITP